jgi:hypothetical protein
MERTLYEIAGGTSLLNDNVAKNRLFGHYAMVLVDLKLSRDIFYEVMMEQEGFAFPVEIEYEGMQEFRTHCKSIGHNITSCRWLHPKKVDKQDRPILVEKGKNPIKSQKQYMQAWSHGIIHKALDPLRFLRLQLPNSSRRHTHIRSFRFQTYRKRAWRYIILSMSSQQRMRRL